MLLENDMRWSEKETNVNKELQEAKAANQSTQLARDAYRGQLETAVKESNQRKPKLSEAEKKIGSLEESVRKANLKIKSLQNGTNAANQDVKLLRAELVEVKG